MKDIVQEEGLRFHAMPQEQYTALAKEVIAAHPRQVNDIVKKGEYGKLGFLLGQMMRQGDRGRMQAPRAEEALRRQLFPNKSE